MTAYLTGVWNYWTSSPDVNPGNGNFAKDNSRLAVSAQVLSGSPVDLTQVVQGDRILLQEVQDATNYAWVRVSGNPVNNSTWFQFPYVLLTQGTTPPQKNRDVQLAFEHMPAPTPAPGGLQPLPYVESLVAEWLRDNMVETPIGGVYSSIPRDPQWPIAVVKRIGGSAVGYWLDKPMIQIESWANGKTEAWKVIEEATRKTVSMIGQVLLKSNGAADDAVITDVTSQFGITWLPDPVTHRDRYIVGLGLVLHPVPA